MYTYYKNILFIGIKKTKNKYIKDKHTVNIKDIKRRNKARIQLIIKLIFYINARKTKNACLVVIQVRQINICYMKQKQQKFKL